MPAASGARPLLQRVSPMLITGIRSSQSSDTCLSTFARKSLGSAAQSAVDKNRQAPKGEPERDPGDLVARREPRQRLFDEFQLFHDLRVCFPAPAERDDVPDVTKLLAMVAGQEVAPLPAIEFPTPVLELCRYCKDCETCRVDCDGCDGTGKQPAIVSVGLRGAIFDARYIELIAALPGAEFATAPAPGEAPARFVFADGGEGAVMPRSKAAKRHFAVDDEGRRVPWPRANAPGEPGAERWSIAGRDMTDEVFVYPDPTEPSRMRRVPAREATVGDAERDALWAQILASHAREEAQRAEHQLAQAEGRTIPPARTH
jgi:hypothetical protein